MWSGFQSFYTSNKGTSPSGLTIQPGSVTPPINGALIVTACMGVVGSATSPTIGSGFTVSDHINFNLSAMAYLVQGTAGATNPSIAAAIAAASLTWYTDIIIAWQDAPNLTLLSAEVERRANAMAHIDARGHFGMTGTFSQQLAALLAVNERFVYASPVTQPGSAPWVWAASAGAICAQYLTQDPSRQLNGIAMPGIVGPSQANALTETEQEQMLVGGGSVFHTHANGTVEMKRYVSTYTVNAAGNPDMAWHDVFAQALAARIRFDWNTYRAALYPRNKQAPDGSLAAANDPSVLTPKRAKASWASRMMVYAANGWVINEIANANAAVFTIDANDPERLNSYLPYQGIGNLIVDAAQLVTLIGG